MYYSKSIHEIAAAALAKPWYQKGDKPAPQKLIPTCHCDKCRRERIRRLISGTVAYLNHRRGLLNEIEGKPQRVASWRVESDGGYKARETQAYYGAL